MKNLCVLLNTYYDLLEYQPWSPYYETAQRWIKLARAYVLKHYGQAI